MFSTWSGGGSLSRQPAGFEKAACNLHAKLQETPSTHLSASATEF